eukprot:10888245-Karenia_brevis.AAC.1
MAKRLRKSVREEFDPDGNTDPEDVQKVKYMYQEAEGSDPFTSETCLAQATLEVSPQSFVPCSFMSCADRPERDPGAEAPWSSCSGVRK